MKYRYRKEDGEHLATIEKDGVRLDTRVCDSYAEAMALRDAADKAVASSFDGLEVHVEVEETETNPETGEVVNVKKAKPVVGKKSDKPAKPKGRGRK
ncbi:MAG: hypothetical protein E6Q97_24725 [Desulfurellales bacterium]|nr:MAG: hypothetical protein E6Q97_24725 [Desulfurellales bacterium]